MTTTSPLPERPVQFGSTRRGLRVVWQPADGPTVARLTFRVGTADERLVERGLTHLLEHLAHRGLDEVVERPAGRHTTALTTTFEARGTAAEVGEYLQTVAEGLAGVGAATPAEVAHEVAVLYQEADGRSATPWDALRRARHGLSGWGLLSSSELGLHGVDAAALERWADRWFTASNAVLVVRGPDAPTWLLPLLGEEGTPPPPARAPVPTALPTQLAAWTRGPAGVVAFTALADATPASAAAWWWLRQRLRDRLLGRDGAAHGVDATTTTLGPAARPTASSTSPASSATAASPTTAAVEQLELAMVVSTTPERQGEVFRAVQEEAARGCREPLPAEALALWQADPGPGASELERLDAVGRAWLLSGDDALPDPDRTDEQEREQRDGAAALTPEAVREALEALLGTALLQVPEGVAAPRGMAALATAPVLPLASGTPFFPARGATDADRLVISPEGVMAEPAGGAATTVRWDRAVAVLRRGDGSRVVVADTGGEVLVDPRRWHEGADAVAALDEAAPAGLHLDVPAPAAVLPAQRSSWAALRPALELVGRWRKAAGPR